MGYDMDKPGIVQGAGAFDKLFIGSGTQHMGRDGTGRMALGIFNDTNWMSNDDAMQGAQQHKAHCFNGYGAEGRWFMPRRNHMGIIWRSCHIPEQDGEDKVAAHGMDELWFYGSAWLGSAA